MYIPNTQHLAVAAAALHCTEQHKPADRPVKRFVIGTS